MLSEASVEATKRSSLCSIPEASRTKPPPRTPTSTIASSTCPRP